MPSGWLSDHLPTPSALVESEAFELLRWAPCVCFVGAEGSLGVVLVDGDEELPSGEGADEYC